MEKQSVFRGALKRKFAVLVELVIICLLMLPLFSVSTYAWFAISKTPSVNDIQIFIFGGDGLELAWDKGDEWTQWLNYQDVVIDNAVLRPVTYSHKEDLFYAATYSYGGRVVDFDKRIDEEQNVNRDDEQGYMVKFSFFGQSGTDISVSLSDSRQGAGTYLRGELGWNDETFENYDMGFGAEMAMRIGLRVSFFDTLGNPDEKEPVFAIYEPNADRHVDGSEGYIETPSIDGTNSLLPTDKLYVQGTTTWEEKFPVSKGEVVYSFGEFLEENKPLFTLDAGCKVLVEVYVWLEGQDVDCENIIGMQAQVFANLVFVSQTINDPGLVD